MAISVSESQIKCGLLNIQSVSNKTFDIRGLLNDDCFSILALTETWLTKFDSAKIREMIPDTHTFVHSPREDKRGGGVGLCIVNSFRKIKMDTSIRSDSFEHLQVSCELGGRNFIFIVVYRPPNLSARLFIDDFRLYLETIDMVRANIIVCGKFQFLD